MEHVRKKSGGMIGYIAKSKSNENWKWIDSAQIEAEEHEN